MRTFNSYTLYVGSADFQARDLCVENSAGDGRTVGLAVACYVDADRAAFYGCEFLAHQDTLCLGPLPANPLPKGLNPVHPVAIAKAAFLRCELGRHIAEFGWDNWDSPANERSAEFAEFGNRGEGAAGERAAWSLRLDEKSAGGFTPQAILSGADGWSPWAGSSD